MKVLKKIKNKISWIFEDLTWLLFRHFLTNNSKNQNNTFTIHLDSLKKENSVTTFSLTDNATNVVRMAKIL